MDKINELRYLDTLNKYYQNYELFMSGYYDWQQTLFITIDTNELNKDQVFVRVIEDLKLLKIVE